MLKHFCLKKHFMLRNNFLLALLFTITFFFLFGSSSCLKSKRPGLPSEVIEVLNISGIHKTELTKFILSTSQTKDSLKIDAAYFLISNLDKNYTAYYKLVDSSGNIYNIIPEDFNNYMEIRCFIDSIESTNGNLIYSADSFAIDYSRVNTNLLTNNMELAFKKWRHNKHWLNYDYQTFKKFILPFKVASEEIECFRQTLNDKFYNTIDSNISFYENIDKINRGINSHIIYDPRYIKVLSAQSVKELIINGKGNLNDINIFKVKALRSLGFAASMDYTPYIADSSGWYAWTTVFSPDGEKIHLDISNGILKELLEHKIPKVYRRTYFEDTSSLYSIKKFDDRTPPYLGHFNMFDVSANYFFSRDTILVNNNDCKYSYLAVFNDNEWRAVDWSQNINGKSNFNNLASGINYKYANWDTNNIVIIGSPFMFNDFND